MSHDLADADRAVASRTAYMQTLMSLHGVAELLLAGTQRRANRSIKLLVTDDGFATGPLPRPPWRLAVRGTDLVVGDDWLVLPLHGTFADLAANAGVACSPPADAYPPASGCKPSDRMHIDHDGGRGFAACAEDWRRCVQGDGGGACADEPAGADLWPEHFDVGITLDEVNYGVSPGDDSIPEAYAYVGPHTARKGKFWNQPFGAARPMTDFADAAAVVAFFEEGRRQAARRRRQPNYRGTDCAVSTTGSCPQCECCSFNKTTCRHLATSARHSLIEVSTSRRCRSCRPNTSPSPCVCRFS